MHYIFYGEEVLQDFAAAKIFNIRISYIIFLLHHAFFKRSIIFYCVNQLQNVASNLGKMVADNLKLIAKSIILWRALEEDNRITLDSSRYVGLLLVAVPAFINLLCYIFRSVCSMIKIKNWETRMKFICLLFLKFYNTCASCYVSVVGSIYGNAFCSCYKDLPSSFSRLYVPQIISTLIHFVFVYGLLTPIIFVSNDFLFICAQSLLRLIRERECCKNAVYLHLIILLIIIFLIIDISLPFLFAINWLIDGSKTYLRFSCNEFCEELANYTDYNLKI